MHENERAGIFVAEQPDDWGVVATAKSGQTLYAKLSNYYDEEIVYAVGSFLNWEQQAFDDGEMLKFVHLPPKWDNALEFTVPSVTQNTPYQWFIVPFGHETNKDLARNYSPFAFTAAIRSVAMP